MNTTKISVYFMPGMGAGPDIFEYIRLPEEIFEMHYLEWEIPEKDISLEEYAKKMCAQLVEKDPVLVGVSFGGILVQEMAKYITVRKIIIISSVKNIMEMPNKMVLAKHTKAHKWLPTSIANHMEHLGRFAFGANVTRRLELYKRYLSIRDSYYLDWCIEQMTHWRQNEHPHNLVHIHGDRDTVFPIKKIKNCVVIKNATHTAIIHRAKWFNDHLPTIILE